MQQNPDIRPLMDELGLRPGIRPLPVHVHAVLAHYAKNPALYHAALPGMTAMAQGIRDYMNHPYRRSMKPLREAWRQGEARLLLCPAAKKRKRGAILIAPSLINRSYILDLLPEKSFARWLAGQGLDVYLLDWGDPVRDGGMADMDGVPGRLGQAMKFVTESNENEPFFALGYCMGGTLLAAAAARMPKVLRGVVFLASPWDFHAGDKVLAQHVRMGAPSALQMIEAGGTLPADWIQSIFATVNADRTAEKFAGFAAMDQGSDRARLFVAVEDWLNDGVAFPGAVARTCIMNWYVENRPPDIGALDIPALVVASTSDRLVPLESSLAIGMAFPRHDVLKPATGHIGMMTGGKAEAEVWRPVSDWLAGIANRPEK